MQIYWHGYSSIRIESKTADQEAVLVTDPFESEASVRFPRTLAPDILVLSHQDVSRFPTDALQSKPFVISDPGEFEVKGVFVQGIQDPTVDAGQLKRPLIYRIVSEGISIGFLGQLNRALTDREIEGLDQIDILLLPVGGGEYLDAKRASQIISEVEPRMVIPLAHDIPGLKMKLGHVDDFCKQLGVCERQDMNKLKISKKDLPVDKLVITVLERA